MFYLIGQERDFYSNSFSRLNLGKTFGKQNVIETTFVFIKDGLGDTEIKNTSKRDKTFGVVMCLCWFVRFLENGRSHVSF